MKLDRLKSKWVEFDTPEAWYNLPDGSVIVIDEAQRVFGNDGSRARRRKSRASRRTGTRAWTFT